MNLTSCNVGVGNEVHEEEDKKKKKLKPNMI